MTTLDKTDLSAMGTVQAETEPTGWQPIETAPHNELVLLYCPDRGCPSNRERIELDYAVQGSAITTRAGRISNISTHAWATHWQPLPDPPKE